MHRGERLEDFSQELMYDDRYRRCVGRRPTTQRGLEHLVGDLAEHANGDILAGLDAI